MPERVIFAMETTTRRTSVTATEDWLVREVRDDLGNEGEAKVVTLTSNEAGLDEGRSVGNISCPGSTRVSRLG